MSRRVVPDQGANTLLLPVRQRLLHAVRTQPLLPAPKQTTGEHIHCQRQPAPLEAAALPGIAVEVGSVVVRREKLSAKHAFRVTAIAEGVATLEPVGGGPAQCAPVGELIALQRFGEPIYPGLHGYVYPTAPA